jgi:hypothetical protein
VAVAMAKQVRGVNRRKMKKLVMSKKSIAYSLGSGRGRESMRSERASRTSIISLLIPLLYHTFGLVKSLLNPSDSMALR